ncbi:four helix bundle protein [Vibrio breoganii]
MPNKRFEDLEVWKRSCRLASDVFKHFANTRDFGFKDQITRSALSVPSNIAEGYERRSAKEFRNFLSYAKGSCGELRTQIYIGVDIEYIQGNRMNILIFKGIA